MRKNDVLTYLHADHPSAALGNLLGSTVLETNNSGVAATDERYFAYGKQRDSGKVTTDHRFTGQKEDGSGLQYFNARFYDPVVGMFVSPDTMVPNQGVVFDYNRYMYARGNAMKFNDPSGHVPVCSMDKNGNMTCKDETVGIETVNYDPDSDANPVCSQSPGCDPYGFEKTMGAALAVGFGTGVAIYLGAGLLLTESGVTAACAEGLCEEAADEDSTVASETTALESIPCANSFSSDTVVLTSDGLESIITLAIGDQVYAYNEATGQTGLYTVTATMVHLDPVIVTLVIDGETIHTTPAHPFYANGHWVDAGKLHVGDAVRKEDGAVGDVESISVAHHAQVMYNLTVAQAHTFFVGHGQWLVHNAGPCAWKSPAGLIYDVGSKEGNRVLHVFEHLADNPNKSTHTVFNVSNSSELLPLLDEAYNNIQTMGIKPLANDPGAYIVQMGRVIGTAGETFIKLVLKPGTTEVLTAYPVK